MFSMANTQPIFVVGMVVTCASFVMLVWAGWHGRFTSWLAAAPAAVVLTWIAYEAMRQSPARPDIGVFGPLTAPFLSFAAGMAVIGIGLVRRRSVPAAPSASRDIGQR